MRISIIVMPMVLCKTGFVFKVLAFRFTDYGAVWIEKDNNGTRVICWFNNLYLKTFNQIFNSYSIEDVYSSTGSNWLNKLYKN